MDNRRLFLAALLSLAVIMVWQMLFPPPPPVSRSAEVQEAPAESVPEVEGAAPVTTAPGVVSLDSEPAPESQGPPVAAVSEERIELETAHAQIVFSNRGAQLLSFRLKDYLDDDGEPLELVRDRGPESPYPFALFSAAGEPLPLNEALFEARREGDTVRFEYRGPLGAARKSFEIDPEGGPFGVEIELPGTSGWASYLGPGIRNPPVSELGDRFKERFASFMSSGELQEIDARKIDTRETIPTDALRWVGLDDDYFISALVPRTPLLQAVAQPVGILTEGDELVGYSRPPAPEAETFDAELLVVPGGDRLAVDAYFGAKKYTVLRDLGIGAERSVRFGMFGIISRPLLYGLNWLYENVVANYGWCIVLMTFFLRLAMLPLTHKSYTSMQKMQKLNPRMEAIRAKYRPKLKDKQGRPNLEMQRKMNEDMQALFREEGVNPVSGCLPILVQMPVFFGFYRLLSEAVELWDAPWALWIHNLAVADPFYVLPIVMGLTQFASMRMTPQMPNPTQRFIMNTMPIWFTIISFGFPSGLVLYWLTNNVLTIVQQGGYNRLKKSGFFGGEDEDASKPALRGAKSRSAKS